MWHPVGKKKKKNTLPGPLSNIQITIPAQLPQQPLGFNPSSKRTSLSSDRTLPLLAETQPFNINRYKSLRRYDVILSTYVRITASISFPALSYRIGLWLV